MYRLLLVLTFVLLGSTLMCGFWLRYSGQKVDDSALSFHMWMAIASVASVIVTLAVRK